MSINTNRAAEPWEKYFLKHKGDELARVTLHILRVAAQQAFFTAEDIHGVEVTSKNIRGAAMRQAARLGLIVKVDWCSATTKQSHGRALFLWKCTDIKRTRMILEKYGMSEVSHPAQQELL